MISPGKVVSLMEILRAHARLYVEAAYFMGKVAGEGHANPLEHQDKIPPVTVGVFCETLKRLRVECEKIEAVCSIDAIDACVNSRV
jgi:hypothetical protein